MRVAVVFFGSSRRDRVAELARGVAEGIEKLGHQVDIIDGEKDSNATLTPYTYVALGTTSTSFFGGRIPDSIATWLGRAGMIAGKKSFAFLLATPLGAQKSLARLMKTMEHEGLFIRFSDVLRSREEAALVGSRLKLES